MLKILKLTLSNYCQHRERTINFSSSTTAITGDNGSGKSNISNACKFALTGEVSNAGARKEDITWGETKGFTELTFSIDNNKYLVKRMLHSSAAILTSVKNSGDVIVADTARDVQEKLETLIGAPLSSVARAFIPQGGLASIIYETPAARAKTFNSLFNTDTHLMRDLLQSTILSATTVAGNQGVVDELETQLKADIIPKLKRYKASIATLNSSLQELPKEDALELIKVYEAHQRDLATNKAKAEKLAALKVELSDFKKTAKLLDKEIPDDVETKLAEISEEIVTLTRTTVEIETYFDEKLAFDTAKQSMSKKQKQLDALEVAKNEEMLNDIITERDEYRASRAEYVNSVKVYTKDLDLMSQGKCPTCNTEFANTEERTKELKKSLAVARSGVTHTNNRLSDLDSEYSEFMTHVMEIKFLHGELTSSIASLKSVKAPKDEKYSDTLAEDVQSELNELSNNLKHINKMIAEKKAVETSITNTEKLIAATAPEKVQGLNVKVKQYEDAKELVKKAIELETEITKTGGALEEAEAGLKETKQRIIKAKETESKYEALGKLRNICERSRDILHPSNLPAAVNRKYIVVLNELISKHLSVFNSGFTAYVSDDFDFMVSFPGDTDSRSALRLSGGQKIVLAISFWFALNELFTGGIGLLVLDEPSTHLDIHAVEGVKEVFTAVSRSMLTTGTQLIVITHEESLKSAFSSHVHIS